MNTAAASRKDVAIQLRVTASRANSLPIDGRAILTDEPMNGVKKELRVATSSAARFAALSGGWLCMWGGLLKSGPPHAIWRLVYYSSGSFVKRRSDLLPPAFSLLPPAS